MKRSVLVGVACGALLVGGCGGSSDSAGDQSETRSSEAAARKPPVDLPKGPKTRKLVVKDVTEGTGATVDTGDKLSVHYVAGIYETGEMIDSAWFEGRYLEFQLGAGDVLPGWEKGLQGMQVGGRRQLVFPSEPKRDTYGTTPGDTLVYIVDLVEAR